MTNELEIIKSQFSKFFEESNDPILDKLKCEVKNFLDKMNNDRNSESDAPAYVYRIDTKWLTDNQTENLVNISENQAKKYQNLVTQFLEKSTDSMPVINLESELIESDGNVKTNLGALKQNLQTGSIIIISPEFEDRINTQGIKIDNKEFKDIEALLKYLGASESVNKEFKMTPELSSAIWDFIESKENDKSLINELRQQDPLISLINLSNKNGNNYLKTLNEALEDACVCNTFERKNLCNTKNSGSTRE
ncbi:MAG: hypothetical protein SFT90_02580 [Rickettsiales bacterium]|nr:hypothetical protein [Rickettsiales bacterium]